MTMTPTPSQMETVVAPAPNDLKHISANMAGGFNKNAKSKVILNKTRETIELGSGEIDPADTLYIKGCSECEINVLSMSTKIFVEGCQKLKLKLNERVITQTIEIWKCDQVDAEALMTY
jgi:hypothetical protein